MAKHVNTSAYQAVNKSRPGVHSKNNTSKSKSSKNYKKKYKGKGR